MAGVGETLPEPVEAFGFAVAFEEHGKLTRQGGEEEPWVVGVDGDGDAGVGEDIAGQLGVACVATDDQVGRGVGFDADFGFGHPLANVLLGPVENLEPWAVEVHGVGMREVLDLATEVDVEELAFGSGVTRCFEECVQFRGLDAAEALDPVVEPFQE